MHAIKIKKVAHLLPQYYSITLTPKIKPEFRSCVEASSSSVFACLACWAAAYTMLALGGPRTELDALVASAQKAEASLLATAMVQSTASCATAGQAERAERAETAETAETATTAETAEFAGAAEAAVPVVKVEAGVAAAAAATTGSVGSFCFSHPILLSEQPASVSNGGGATAAGKDDASTEDSARDTAAAATIEAVANAFAGASSGGSGVGRGSGSSTMAAVVKLGAAAHAFCGRTEVEEYVGMLREAEQQSGHWLAAIKGRPTFYCSGP